MSILIISFLNYQIIPNQYLGRESCSLYGDAVSGDEVSGDSNGLESSTVADGISVG